MFINAAAMKEVKLGATSLKQGSPEYKFRSGLQREQKLPRNGQLFRIVIRDGVETVRPWGNYSMCLSVGADKVFHDGV